MKRGAILAMAALALSACHPTAEDSSGRDKTPAGNADAPAAPTEPASAPTAPPAAAVNADFLGSFDARGTEPFWSLRIAADGLAFSRPGQAEVKTANPGPKMEGKSAVWASSDGTLEVTLTRTHCSDGMSDRDYPYQAVVVAGGQTLSGCARPGAASG